MTSSFFEPSMNVLLFLMVKKLIYLEVLYNLCWGQGHPAHWCSTVFVIHHYRNLYCRDRRAFRRSLLSKSINNHGRVLHSF